MANLPEDIECRRFVRPVGVTGLGAGADSRSQHRLRTVTGEFAGVLATDVRPEADAPPAQLSYLTLAPLLADALASGGRGRRDAGGAGGPPRAAGARCDDAATGEETGGEDREPTVREVIRDRSTGASERFHPSGDLTVTDGPPDRESGRARDERPAPASEPAERDPASNGPDASSESPDASPDGPRPDPADRTGPDAARDPGGPTGPVHRGPRTGRPAELTVADPAQMIVEQSGSAGLRATDARDGPGWSATKPGRTDAEWTGSRGPAPTTVARRLEATGEGSGKPALAVTSPQSVGGATDADADQRDGRDGPQVAGSDGDDAVRSRAVIRSDGRVNERVLDRLYDEISRKMRLDRAREGR